jgi:toxin CcdB
MAQFDVHRVDATGAFVIDCQSDLLDDLNTRLVVPVVPRDAAPAIAQQLNPVFAIAERDYVMVTQFAAAVQRRELGSVVVSLKDRGFEVIGALDVLTRGV